MSILSSNSKSMMKITYEKFFMSLRPFWNFRHPTWRVPTYKAPVNEPIAFKQNIYKKHGMHNLSTNYLPFIYQGAQNKRNDDVGYDGLPNSCFNIPSYFWWTPYTDFFDMILARPELEILAAPTRERLLEFIFRNHKNWNYLTFWHLC